ncbi:hypothetical protein [Aquimarina hainanensis]|uniref:hypothetical protein n=1 Tax=Aquimarina hainanensis TaxID=1578017 RepID=UPI0036155484
MPKSKFSKIFEPGYTSKSRGWGLGLSLAKRIIESYHSGELKSINLKYNHTHSTYLIFFHQHIMLYN